MKAPFTITALAYAGKPPDAQTFESFDEAAAECDRMNRSEDWVAEVRDADGVTVRDHHAIWKAAQ
jgi:hypothetical protein